MSKYQPIEQHLLSCRSTEVPMSFAEIERVIGGRLPAAARNHRAWWSNNPSNNVMTKAWLAAGYGTERVDMSGERLVFRRKSDFGARAVAPPVSTSVSSRPGLMERLRHRLGGTVTVAEGVDLTAPTGAVWDAER